MNEWSEIVWGIWCLRVVWSYFVFPLCRKEKPYALNCIIARHLTGSNHNMWEPERSSHTTCSSSLGKKIRRIEGEWLQLKVMQLIKTKSVLYLPLFSLSAKLAAFPFYFYSLFEKKLILKIYKVTDSQNLQKFHSNTLKPIWNHEDQWISQISLTPVIHSFI